LSSADLFRDDFLTREDHRQRRPVAKRFHSKPLEPKRAICSAKCRGALQARRAKQLRTLRRSERDCPCCRTKFTPKRVDGRYCSLACIQAAYRNNRRTAAAFKQRPALEEWPSNVVARTRRLKSPIPRSCYLRQIERQEVGFRIGRIF